VERHVNRRGWIVLDSIGSADGSLCVDLFERPAGGFGFESFRADAEDGGRWTPVGGFSATRYETAADAAAAALAAVAWAREEPRARARLERRIPQPT
jgi:hypothetical protein